MQEQRIITHEGLEVRISGTANEDILSILNQAVQGSERV